MDVGGRRWFGPAEPESDGAFRPYEVSSLACRSLFRAKFYLQDKFLVYTSYELLLHRFSEMNGRYTRDLLASRQVSSASLPPADLVFL